MMSFTCRCHWTLYCFSSQACKDDDCSGNNVCRSSAVLHERQVPKAASRQNQHQNVLLLMRIDGAYTAAVISRYQLPV